MEKGIKGINGDGGKYCKAKKKNMRSYKMGTEILFFFG